MRAGFLVVCVVVGLGAIAHAGVNEDAKRAFAEGQAADKRGDWQAGIEAYLRAYDAVPHPFAFYNIGYDYEQLQRLRDAVHYYELYLQSPEATDRDKLKAKIVELHARPAKLTVRSDPDGARLSIDGQPIGTTPYLGRLKGGRHKIAIDKDDQHEEKVVTVDLGEPVDLTLTLEGGSGTLVVDGTPVGAKVSIDGSEAGTIPLSAKLAAGEHTMSITLDGYTPAASTIAITANRVTEIHPHLAGGGSANGDGSARVRGYYGLGFIGGADVRGNGGAFGLDIALRAEQYEFALTIGKVVGQTSVEVVLRYGFNKGGFQPLVGAGYSYIGNSSAASGSSSDSSSALGLEAFAGIRADLYRGDLFGLSLLGLFTARYRTVSSADSATEAAGVFPITGTLQLYYRINRNNR